MWESRPEEATSDDYIRSEARRADSLIAFVIFILFGSLFDSFSEGLTEVFLHPPRYLSGTRVWTGTVSHTLQSDPRTDTTCVEAQRSEVACLPVFTTFSTGVVPGRSRSTGLLRLGTG